MPADHKSDLYHKKKTASETAGPVLRQITEQLTVKVPCVAFLVNYVMDSVMAVKHQSGWGGLHCMIPVLSIFLGFMVYDFGLNPKGAKP